MPKKIEYIEVVKITKNPGPDTWTVHLKSDSEVAQLKATIAIENGKVVGGVMDWENRDIQR
jgi:hypothetical protein